MFKEIKLGITKAFSKKWMLILLFVLLVIGLCCYSCKKNGILDMMTTGDETTMSNHDPNLEMPVTVSQPSNTVASPVVIISRIPFFLQE